MSVNLILSIVMFVAVFMVASPLPMVSGYGGSVNPYDDSLSCREGFTVVIRINNPAPICIQIPTAEKWIKNGLATYPETETESASQPAKESTTTEEADTTPTPIPIEKEEVLELLFVQTAKSAELKPIFGAPYTHKLLLHDVSPSVIYFSDRPYRVSGLYNLTDFMQIWYLSEDSFSLDPPNVAIEAFDGDSTRTIIAELTSPTYDPDTGTMTYDAKISSDEKLPENLDSVALFIDNWFTKTWHHVKHSVSHEYHKVKHEVKKDSKKVDDVAKKAGKTTEDVGKDVYKHAKDHPIDTLKDEAEDYYESKKKLEEEAAKDALKVGEHSTEDVGDLTAHSFEDGGKAGLDELEGKSGAAKEEWEKGGKELNQEAKGDADNIANESVDDAKKLGKHAIDDACKMASDAGARCDDVISDYENQGKHHHSSESSESIESGSIASSNVVHDQKFAQEHKQWSGDSDAAISKAAKLAFDTYRKQEQKGISTSINLKSQLDSMQTQLENLMTEKQKYDAILKQDSQNETAKKQIASLNSKIQSLESSIADVSSKKDKAESDLTDLRKGLATVADINLLKSHSGVTIE